MIGVWWPASNGAAAASRRRRLPVGDLPKARGGPPRTRPEPRQPKARKCPRGGGGVLWLWRRAALHASKVLASPATSFLAKRGRFQTILEVSTAKPAPHASQRRAHTSVCKRSCAELLARANAAPLQIAAVFGPALRSAARAGPWLVADAASAHYTRRARSGGRWAPTRRRRRRRAPNTHTKQHPPPKTNHSPASFRRRRP